MEQMGSAETESARTAARRRLAMRIAHRNRLRAERLARLRTDAAPASQVETPPASFAASSPPFVFSSISPPVSLALQTEPPAESPERSVPKPAIAVSSQASLPPSSGSPSDPVDDGAAALEDFLRALSQSGAAVSGFSAPEPAAADLESAAVLPFQRPHEFQDTIVGEGVDPHSEPRAAPVCDLHRLEGAGPGLIWALRRAGIACLSELAPLETADIVSRLGPLGHLVPVQAWIDTARAE